MRITARSAAVLLFTLLASGPAGARRVPPPPFDEAAALAEARLLGIPESDVPGWIRFKRAEWESGLVPGSLPPGGPLPTPIPFDPGCVNGDLELGNLTNWQPLAGNNTLTTGLSLGASAPLPGRHTVVGPGPDPVVPAIPQVLGGARALRLGNSLSGSQAEGITYPFVVNGSNALFKFSYAMVLEDLGHPLQEQPFFSYQVKTAAGTVVKTVRRVASAGDPYFTRMAGTNALFKNWDCESIDLGAYLGQAMTITFTTADCQPGGHYGYAYVDDLCTSTLTPSFTLPDSACLDAPLVADGSATKNETDVFWSIEESDANWGRNAATEVSQWFPAQQAGPFDLKAFYASKGKTFKCNQYYRIKLAVKNGCEPWKETVRLLYVRCPPLATAGPNRSVCCSQAASVQLGAPAQPGLSYAWTSSPSGFTSALANPSAPVTCDSSYDLTVTDAFGCKAQDSATVRIDRPFDLSIRVAEASTDVCDRSSVLSANLAVAGPACVTGINCAGSGKDPSASFAWSTGANTFSIPVNPAAPTVYAVTATNACTTKTAQVTVSPCPAMTGAFPSLLFPNAFTPNGDGKNDTFVIYHLGIGAGDKPAYNAINWEFIVFDRFGGEIAHRSGGADQPRCQGIPNGAIPNWDGRSDNGSLLPIGVYTWRLYLRNCSHRDLTPVKMGSVTIVR